MTNPQPIKRITVQAGQSLPDIALQEYGTVEGIILLIQANPGLSVSDDITGGQELIVFTSRAINLVKELVKTEAFGAQLQGLLMQWISLVNVPGAGGIAAELDPVFTAWLETFVPFSGSYTDLIDKPTFATDFLSLTDVPATSYVGKAKNVPIVNDAENAIDFAATVQALLTQMQDYPASHLGQALKLLRVKADETGVEFVTSDFINGITKAMVEAVLTGSIISHNHPTDPLFTPVVLPDTLTHGKMEFEDDGTNGHLSITMNVNGTLRRARLAIEAIPDPAISNIVISNITDDGFTVTCQINPYGLLTPVLHYGETIAYGLTVVGNPISLNSSVSFVVAGITNFADCFVKVVAGSSQLAYVGQLLVKNAWYGIERDITASSADWTRIGGDMTLHASLPVQSSLKGVLLNADKTVNYYLKADDWTKKADGSASVLTGADGNVMVRKDADTYWKFETAGNIQRVKCSMYPLVGFSKIEKWNIGAYEAKLVSTKLSSVAGVLPTTSRSETQFRADARANGAGYNQQWNEPYTEIVWMFIVEYATNNFQKAVNATLTDQGYKQGGLGNGVSTAVSTEWSAFNGYNPFITCGASDSLANGSGEVSVIIADFGGAGINRTFTVPRYRGIENLYGHIWKWVDGVSINHLASTREVWIFDDPALIADNTSVNARLAGLLPSAGYVKTLIFDSKGCILPATVGGAPTTYFCDYLYTPQLGIGWKALISGGAAHAGAYAGPLSADTSNGASSAYAHIGARLFAR